MNATHAIVVPFEELAPVVDGLRERTCVSKPSHGMPPHVTLLYPAPSDVNAIAEVLVAFVAFDVVFARLERFPGTLWLAPEPAEPFRRVIEALVRRFPEQRPYDGAFAEVVPHLTVAQSRFEEAVASVEPSLPLCSRAKRAVLLAQAEPHQWRELAAFELENR
jgi:2'-5' RNA ligase